MRIFNDKKGIERVVLITLIFAVVGFAIILWWWFIAKPYTGVDTAACTASIVLRSVAIVSEPLKAATPLQCKTEQIKIDKNYKTEEQIKNKIATAMTDCWGMVGKGGKNFMPKDSFSEEYCLICSSIQFDEKTKKEFPIISGLLDYMKATDMPGQQITYYEYIWGKDPTSKKDTELLIDTSKDYAVLFALYKEGTFTPNLFKTIGGGGAALIAGFMFPPAGMAGAALYIMTGYAGASLLSFFSTSAGRAGLSLVPYEGKEIEKYCTRFENAP